jgi:hypothetical protein
MKKIALFAMSMLLVPAVCVFSAQNTLSFVLFDSQKDINETQTQSVSASISSTNAHTLLVETEPNKEYPGVIFKPKAGTWDMSQYPQIAVQLKNTGAEPVRLYLQVDNSNANMGSNSNLQSVMLKPGEKRKLSTFLMLGPWKFDKPISLIGLRGSPGDKDSINPSKITQVCVMTERTVKPQRFEIESVKAEGQFTILNADTFIPFIDQFGQFIHGDWPGKTHSLEEMQQRRQTEEKQLTENPGPDNWDTFGGYKAGPKLNTTGFFRVEKSNGSWWLVDPNGYLFWSHGIDCVRMAEATPITDREKYFTNLPEANSPSARFYGMGSWAPHGYYQQHTPYKTYHFAMSNLLKKYGPDFQRINSDTVHKRLRCWGLNTIANWSSDVFYSMHKTPYVATIGYDAKKIEGSSGYWGKFYDVFDPGFRQSVSRRMEREKGKSAGDPWCLGFFVDNELSWGDETSLGLAVLASPAEQQAKKVLVDNLKAKYQTIEKLNAAWGTNFASWDLMLQDKFNPPDKEKWARTKAFADLSAFYTKTAETYFAVVREEVKKIAPNQLYLGCRFAWVNDLAIRAAAKYCDVVSFNFYTYGVEDIRLPASPDASRGGPDNIDMPIIIGEFHFGALDRGMFHPGLKRAADQQDRADKYSEYVRGALRNPYIVGTHWFQYQDQPTTGRGDGENYQIGFVDIADTPYEETIAASQKIGRTMYEYRLKNK